MKIIKAKNKRELSEIASEIIIGEIKKNPRLVLGFATGKTPLKTYKKLVKAYKNGKVDFSKVKTFNLDEFYPPSSKKDEKRNYAYYMHKRVFDKLNIEKENINLLDGNKRDWKKECKKYESKIKKNPIDLQILGIGVNGHIGFNEPGSKINSLTRLVQLTHIEGKGLTMGISTIMKTKKIILLAFGRKKAKAIYGMVNGKVSEELPASFLRKHKNVVVIVDRKAGRLL